MSHLPISEVLDSLKYLDLLVNIPLVDMLLRVTRLLGHPGCRIQSLTFDFARCSTRHIVSQVGNSESAERVVNPLRAALRALSSLEIFTLKAGDAARRVFHARSATTWSIFAAILLCLPIELQELHIVASEFFSMDLRLLQDACERLQALHRFMLCGDLDTAVKTEIRQALHDLVERNALHFDAIVPEDD